MVQDNDFNKNIFVLHCLLMKVQGLLEINRIPFIFRNMLEFPKKLRNV